MLPKIENIIEENEVLRDLGVQMSSDPQFNLHINNIVKDAQKMSAWALRTFRTRKTGPMLTIWKSLIRSRGALIVSDMHQEFWGSTEEC